MASDQRVTHWTVTATVHSDRKNIFAFAGENGAHQVGTLVAGSKTKLDRFDADARLIGKAPELYAHLLKLTSLIEEPERAGYDLVFLAQVAGGLRHRDAGPYESEGPMNRYECSGCGEMSCDGECFSESSPDAVEFAENLKLLREKYGNPFGTVVHGDHLLGKDRKAA